MRFRASHCFFIYDFFVYDFKIFYLGIRNRNNYFLWYDDQQKNAE
jgi:hypothetical protein